MNGIAGTGVSLWGLLLAALLASAVLAALFAARRRIRRQAFRRSLDQLRWSEFCQAVLQGLAARDWHPELWTTPPSGANVFETVMLRHGERALLSCRHGSGLHLSPRHIDELAKARDTSGATHAILASNGLVSAAALQRARERGVDLIADDALQDLVAPHVPAIERSSRAFSGQVFWRGCLAAAAGASLVLALDAFAPQFRPAPTSSPPTAAVPALLPAETPKPAEHGIAAKPEPSATPTPDQAQQRAAIARAVSKLPGISHALWASGWTLVVALPVGQTQIDPAQVEQICAEIRAVRAEANARLQFETRAAAGKPPAARWRLCQ